MKIKGVVLILTLLLAIQAAAALNINRYMKPPAVDRVLINEIAHEQGLEAAIKALENPLENYEDSKGKMTAIFAISGILEILLMSGYLIYIQRTVFHPFHSLKSFAERVAGGDLDIPLKMDKGNAFGAFTESFDIMRDALKTSREQEAEANRSKKELIAKLSHDIKTPVSSISAVTELMQASAEDEKTLEQLRIIRDKADQIDRLTSDLFNATLEELQRLTVTPSEHSGEELHNIILTADYQNKAIIGVVPSCLLIFDPQRLQQTFDNVFANAYKYGGGEIEVSCAIRDRSFAVEVLDVGSSVIDEEISLLFEKFYRGKNAEGKSGSGLGLYISRYLIVEMGGEIFCRNTERGFIVEIILKLA